MHQFSTYHQQFFTSFFQDQSDQHIVKFLNSHGLAGQAYKFLDKYLSTFVLTELKKKYHQQWALNCLLEQELEEIQKRCLEKKIKLVVLKGMALINNLYSDPGLRAISDIDLLVEKKDWDYFKEILIQLGHQDVSCTRWEYNDYKINTSRFVDDIEVVVEGHLHLFKNDNWPMWNKTHLGKGDLLGLSLEDNLVHLMGHLAYQHTFLKLTWLLDIFYYLERYENQLNWELINKKIKHLNHKSSSWASLWCMEKYFGLHFLQKINSANQIGLLKKFLITMSLSKKLLWYPEKNRFKYYLLKHLLKDSLLESLRYDYYWFIRKAWK